MFFRAISTETVPNVSSHHFFTFFDNKHACCHRRVFSVMYSCCCLTGLDLGLGLNMVDNVEAMSLKHFGLVSITDFIISLPEPSRLPCNIYLL